MTEQQGESSAAAQAARLLARLREPDVTPDERGRLLRLLESVKEELATAWEAEEPSPIGWPTQPVEAPAPAETASGLLDFTGEEPQPYTYVREPIPPREQSRRRLMIGLSVTFGVVFLLQLGFAVLGGEVWERVGPVLSWAATLLAAGWGYVWGHYFSGRD